MPPDELALALGLDPDRVRALRPQPRPVLRDDPSAEPDEVPDPTLGRALEAATAVETVADVLAEHGVDDAVCSDVAHALIELAQDRRSAVDRDPLADRFGLDSRRVARFRDGAAASTVRAEEPYYERLRRQREQRRTANPPASTDVIAQRLGLDPARVAELRSAA